MAKQLEKEAQCWNKKSGEKETCNPLAKKKSLKKKHMKQLQKSNSLNTDGSLKGNNGLKGARDLATPLAATY